MVDTYSPTVAFDLRKISSSATNCIRVRRASDNAEQDIGFSGNDLDTSALSSFSSGTDSVIVKWYNQGTGGATYDMVQTVTASQPVIYTGGAVVTVNGKPAMSNTGSRYLEFTNTFTTNCSLFSVTSSSTATGTPKIMLGQGASGAYLWLCLDGSTSTTVYSASGTPSLYVNSALLSSPTRDDLDTNFTGQALGSTLNLDLTSWSLIRTLRGGNNPFDYWQSLILFDTDESANRTAIETNINSYYTIT